jgi:hypothetical protein
MSASNIIAFRHPDAPLEGPKREAAIQAYREAAEAIAERAITKAFGFLARLPDCRGLGCEDVLPLFCEAFRRELDKPGNEIGPRP